MGEYVKGWDFKRKQQKAGATKGETVFTGKVVRIKLYRCKKCRRLFRKADTKIEASK